MVCVILSNRYQSVKIHSAVSVSKTMKYCNCLYRGLSKSNLRRLQCLQNAFTRVVTGSS